MTPRQLIDACRATNQPLPGGRKIAEVVERLVEERKSLALAVVALTRHSRLFSDDITLAERIYREES